MKKVALATSLELAELVPDDLLLLPALSAHGIDAKPAVWDSPEECWSGYDAVVIRSPWDYHAKPGSFRRWLEGLEAARVRVFNPVEVLRWNLDKTYLREVERKGFPIVPTAWLSFEGAESLRGEAGKHEWAKVVVKPTVSAGARHTFLLDVGEREGWASLDAELPRGLSLMMQPFAEEIVQEGEYSFHFFGGRFSHAVLKCPKAGDFRVQEKHGGEVREVRDPEPGRKAAQKLLDLLRLPLLYARVDLVRRTALREVRWELMELEVLEPSLYLSSCPAAPENFARALAGSLCS